MISKEKDKTYFSHSGYPGATSFIGVSHNVPVTIKSGSSYTVGSSAGVSCVCPLALATTKKVISNNFCMCIMIEMNVKSYQHKQSKCVCNELLNTFPSASINWIRFKGIISVRSSVRKYLRPI